MIGDAIETFRNTTEAVNQNLVRKCQYETNTCHEVKKSKIEANFAAYFSRFLTKQVEKEQLLEKKRLLLTVNTR